MLKCAAAHLGPQEQYLSSIDVAHQIPPYVRRRLGRRLHCPAAAERQCASCSSSSQPWYPGCVGQPCRSCVSGSAAYGVDHRNAGVAGGIRSLTIDIRDVPVAVRRHHRRPRHTAPRRPAYGHHERRHELAVANDDHRQPGHAPRQRSGLLGFNRTGVYQGHPPARCRTRIEGDRQPAGRLAIHRRRPRSAGRQYRQRRRHTRRLRPSSRCQRPPR